MFRRNMSGETKFNLRSTAAFGQISSKKCICHKHISSHSNKQEYKLIYYKLVSTHMIEARYRSSPLHDYRLEVIHISRLCIV